ncbi:hypothetical protein [Mesobacillus foraminis]|uniref:hypothetical protein n=1 Tax=Mesobacillus foraminis TaxID=279826 RepID=UPI001304F048|nr:hypothetical protein [Mesobacillus foraminis]
MGSRPNNNHTLKNRVQEFKNQLLFQPVLFFFNEGAVLWNKEFSLSYYISEECIYTPIDN